MTMPPAGRMGSVLPVLLLLTCLVFSDVHNVLADSKSKSTNKLVDYIHKRKYDDFIKELNGVDPNQPDSTGRLPLMEAVKSKDMRFMDALIQFGAMANSKEPGTLAAPIQVAFQTAQVEAARLLLAYGADINAADKSGSRPRDFAPLMEIHDLIRMYDEKGAQAFEDPPGTWIKTTTEKGEDYWYHAKTQEARWNMPPSCGWQRVQHQGLTTLYHNIVTGQETLSRPAPLCWRLVRSGGKDMWYNWHANITQVEQPSEMPYDMTKEARGMKNVRWYNTRTGEYSWEDPLHHTPWRQLEDEEHGVYYYNLVTGDSRWQPPEELAWQQQEAPEEAEPGHEVWHNTVTGAVTHERPGHHAWQRHTDDL